VKHWGFFYDEHFLTITGEMVPGRGMTSNSPFWISGFWGDWLEGNKVRNRLSSVSDRGCSISTK